MCVSIFIADIINTQMLTNKRQDKMFHYSCKGLTVEKEKFEQKRIDIYHWLCVVYICCMVWSFSEKSSVCTRTRTRKPLAFIYVCTSEDGSLWIVLQAARPSKCSYFFIWCNKIVGYYNNGYEDTIIFACILDEGVDDIFLLYGQYCATFLVGRSVSWYVGRFVDPSVVISSKDGKLHFHAPMGALVQLYIWVVHVRLLYTR